MAIGMIFDVPGVTQAQYDQVHNQVMPGNRPPTGMLYHAAGPTESGWCVVEIWESQQAAQTFFDETLGAALKEAKIEAQPRAFQVHNVTKA